MVSTLAHIARDVGSISALGAIFPIFITPTILFFVNRILYKLCTVLLLNLPCVCICKVTACMYVIVSIKKTYNSSRTTAVVCTDLSGREPHRQVGMGRVVKSGRLCGVMVITLEQMLVRIPLWV